MKVERNGPQSLPVDSDNEEEPPAERGPHEPQLSVHAPSADPFETTPVADNNGAPRPVTLPAQDTARQALETSPVATTPLRFGRYEVKAEVGRGAMGIVYRAQDPMLRRDIALKIMSPRLVGNPDFHALFLKEGQTAAQLTQHENLVGVLDCGYFGDNQPFLALEFVTGTDLKTALASSEGITEKTGIEIACSILRGLQHAHKLNVVHRDIKPANIMLCADGTTKITDFGLARIAEADATGTGAQVGTPAYMSPEQARQEKVDGRADLFSAGVTLYEILARKSPFKATDLPTTLYNVCHHHPDYTLVGPRFREIVRRALEKKAEKRFQSAEEFRVALEQAMADPRRAATTNLEPRPSRNDRLDRLGRRILDRITRTPPLWFGVGSGVLVALLSVLSLALRLDSVADGDRSVGFLETINWAGGGLWLWPFIVFFLMELVQSVPPAINKLQAQNMVRWSNNLDPARKKLLLRRWQHLLRRAMPYFIVVVGITVVPVFWEWLTYMALPLWKNVLGPGDERDWTVAVLLDGKHAFGSRLLNGAFDLMVWSTVALACATLLLLHAVLFVAILLFSELEGGKKGLRLVPNVDSPDPRRGYEALQVTVESGLAAAGFSYLWFLTFRLSDLYLNEGSEPGGRQFVFELFVNTFGALTSCSGGSECIPRLIELLEVNTLRWTGFFAVFGALFLLVPALWLPVVVLGRVATSGRRELRKVLVAGQAPPEQLAALKTMTYFPLTYLNPGILFIAVGSSTAAVIWFKLAPVVILAWVIVLGGVALKSAMRNRDDD